MYNDAKLDVPRGHRREGRKQVPRIVGAGGRQGGNLVTHVMAIGGANRAITPGLHFLIGRRCCSVSPISPGLGSDLPFSLFSTTPSRLWGGRSIPDPLERDTEREGAFRRVLLTLVVLFLVSCSLSLSSSPSRTKDD